MDAIEVGMTSVVELNVANDFDDYGHIGRLHEVSHFVSVASSLNLLTIRADPIQRYRDKSPKPIHFFQNIQACATVTQIQVNNNDRDDFDADEMRLLQKLTTRNQELARFITNPSTYPTDELLALIPDLDNCPTGRYMLARRLPGVFSFATIQNTQSKKLKRRERKTSRRADF